jgi:hypothetical protein
MPSDSSSSHPSAGFGVSDELTSRDQGLIAGHTYAARYQGDPVKLRHIVRARTAEEVRANVEPTVIEPAGLDSLVAFWSGFAHGVAAFLVEEGARQPQR